jgi:hypothetical protein
MFIATCAATIVVAACSRVSFPPPPGVCENRGAQEFLSADGLYKAVQFSRLCGTDEPTLNISVLSAHALLPNEPGNVLVEASGQPHDQYHDRRIEMTWSGRTLRIAHKPEMKIQVSASQVGDVTVVHSTTFEVGS